MIYLVNHLFGAAERALVEDEISDCLGMNLVTSDFFTAQIYKSSLPIGPSNKLMGVGRLYPSDMKSTRLADGLIEGLGISLDSTQPFN